MDLSGQFRRRSAWGQPGTAAGNVSTNRYGQLSQWVIAAPMTCLVVETSSCQASFLRRRIVGLRCAAGSGGTELGPRSPASFMLAPP